MTDRTWLRRDLSATLYLLANYFSVINSTIKSQLDNTGGNPDTIGTPAHHLQRIRRKIFGKVMVLLPSMKQHADWQKWEPTIGGKFPRASYEDIIKRSTRVMSYLTFMSYTMNHPIGAHAENNGRKDSSMPHDPKPYAQHQRQLSSSSRHSSASAEAQEPTPSNEQVTTDTDTDRAWLDALSSVLQEISSSQHNIVSTLTLLSNSLFSGQSLPPFLPLPRPYEMTRALLRLDSNNQSTGQEADLSPLMVVDSRTGLEVDHTPTEGGLGGHHILDAANMEQPGYAEFAVLEICNTLICDDLEGLVKDVGALVGVVDFSYTVDGRSGSTLWSQPGKGKVD
jgi:hypothetical protein